MAREILSIPPRREFDDRALGREKSIRRYQVKLDSARSVAAGTELLLNFPGTVLYCDKLSDGAATLRFDDRDGDQMPVGANFGLSGMPFTRLIVENAAQSGKILNLWYGFDAAIIPPTQDIASIGSVGSIGLLSAVTPAPLGGNSYFRLSISAALWTIVSPAANVNGIAVRRALIHATGARLMAKGSAPATWNDVAARSILTVYSGPALAVLPYPLLIPPGLGLYEQTESSNYSLAEVGYDIL